MIARINDEMYHIYADAIVCYGTANQIRMAIEEMSELTKELCKFFRESKNVEAIASEIADVSIMLEQLIMIFGCRGEVIYYVDKKTERLRDRLAVFHGG